MNENDIGVYQDDSITIIKKDAKRTGTLEVPYTLLDIALAGMEQENAPRIFTREVHAEIMLVAIERIEKIIAAYPGVEPKPKLLLK